MQCVSALGTSCSRDGRRVVEDGRRDYGAGASNELGSPRYCTARPRRKHRTVRDSLLTSGDGDDGPDLRRHNGVDARHLRRRASVRFLVSTRTRRYRSLSHAAGLSRSARAWERNVRGIGRKRAEREGTRARRAARRHTCSVNDRRTNASRRLRSRSNADHHRRDDLRRLSPSRTVRASIFDFARQHVRAGQRRPDGGHAIHNIAAA